MPAARTPARALALLALVLALAKAEGGGTPPADAFEDVAREDGGLLTDINEVVDDGNSRIHYGSVVDATAPEPESETEYEFDDYDGDLPVMELATSRC